LNPDQPIFIDRDPECFDLIMEYFRGNKLPVNFVPFGEKYDVLLEEAQFYEIKGLIDQIHTKCGEKPVESKKQLQENSHAKTSDGIILSEGLKLMNQFELEIESKLKELSYRLQLNSKCTEEQSQKIRRYFGWTPVKVDVGGVLFEAGSDTLSKIPKFNELFCQESDGTIFIDRAPTAFNYVLRFLRAQSISTRSMGSVRSQFKQDIDFYGLECDISTSRIEFTDIHNVMFESKSNQYVCSGGGVSGWIKNAKSFPLGVGTHSMSIKIVRSVARNIMIGCDGDKSVRVANIYGTGKSFLCANSNVHGSWPSATTPAWGALKDGDIVTLTLDTEQKSLTVYLNANPNGVLICSNIPTLSLYYFYVLSHDDNDVFQIVDQPF
jgi:hypothetical protein